MRSDLVNTVIRSPIDGVVLRLRTRAGERPADDGVLEVGAIQQMRAELEVVEITPQIRQREVLPTTAPADVDVRVVLVRVELDPVDRERVRRVQGAKLIARIGP